MLRRRVRHATAAEAAVVKHLLRHGVHRHRGLAPREARQRGRGAAVRRRTASARAEWSSVLALARAPRPAPCATRAARAPAPLPRLAPPTRREAQPSGAGTARRHSPEEKRKRQGGAPARYGRAHAPYTGQQTCVPGPGRRPATSGLEAPSGARPEQSPATSKKRSTLCAAPLRTQRPPGRRTRPHGARSARRLWAGPARAPFTKSRW